MTKRQEKTVDQLKEWYVKNFEGNSIEALVNWVSIGKIANNYEAKSENRTKWVKDFELGLGFVIQPAERASAMMLAKLDFSHIAKWLKNEIKDNSCKIINPRTILTKYETFQGTLVEEKKLTEKELLEEKIKNQKESLAKFEQDLEEKVAQQPENMVLIIAQKVADLVKENDFSKSTLENLELIVKSTLKIITNCKNDFDKKDKIKIKKFDGIFKEVA